MFVGLLVVASVLVSVTTVDTLKPLRMTGPAVKQWSGYVLILLGVWFVVLAVLPSPVLI